MGGHLDGKACTAGWSIMASPNPSSQGNELLSVDGVSASDVWAVGGRDLDAATNQSGNGTTTLTVHWDGSRWTAKPSPTVSGIYTALYGVAAITANNAWAVGFSSNPGPDSTGGAATEFNHGLILHWDGSSWTQVANPVGSTNNELRSVFALSATNVYAAGFVGKSGGPTQVPLVLHYDGSAWKRVSVPSVGNSSGFFAIGASSAQNVWAVGWRGPFRGNDDPFAERYDGHAWHIVSPSSPASGWLSSVLVLDPNIVWAAGGQGADFYNSKALAERYNGSVWSEVETAAVSQPDQRFNGIAAASASSIWMVGDKGTDPMGASTLIEHSIGGDLSQQPSPARGSTSSLSAVAAFGAKEFAVGLSHDSGKWHTLILRRCG
jgi:hypothetical protein